MAYQFKKHYTRDEARALLPLVQQWLGQLRQLRETLVKGEQRLSRLVEPGRDLGGVLVNQWVRDVAGLQGVLFQFFKREIQIKDLERGLLDFPSIMGGKEVFFCWEQGEEDIDFWHHLDAGYAGRERL